MRSTMMDVPLSLNHLLDRAGHIFGGGTIVSRLPDKTLRRHSYAEYHRRTRALAAALASLGLKKGERVATLCWNHHAHLEAYFGIPAAGGVMHTLNLRLAPAEIGWIAADAKDRFLIVDDILLPLYRQFAELHRFERVIVFPFSGAPVPEGFDDYEQLLADADADGFVYPPHDENDPVAMCYTSGTTGRPKGVAYSHRSTILHTLVGCLADFWGLKGTDVLMPVTPMFHANCWGVPYAAVMMGVKLVFPGPHLHPDDLLDLMQQEPPTLSLGVPTIWLGLIQAYERSLAEQPGRWKMPQGMRSLVGGAAVPESRCSSTASRSGSCPIATRSSTRCRAPRPASSGSSSCGSASRSDQDRPLILPWPGHGHDVAADHHDELGAGRQAHLADVETWPLGAPRRRVGREAVLRLGDAHREVAVAVGLQLLDAPSPRPRR
jgi:fatty-acyl-CoA synthase